MLQDGNIQALTKHFLLQVMRKNKPNLPVGDAMIGYVQQ
jgi:hypothetical protein